MNNQNYEALVIGFGKGAFCQRSSQYPLLDIYPPDILPHWIV